MGQLTYKIQSNQARLARLEKLLTGVQEWPPFNFKFNPGANEELQRKEDTELLICGGIGSGKTSAAMAKIHRLCLENKGVRALVLRKMRADLNETALAEYEGLVLGAGHPLLKGPSRYNRRVYIYPNSSRIVLGGVDNIERIQGSSYDIIYVCEATQLNLNEWEYLTGRLRNNRLPFQQLIGCANPQNPTHWLYKRYEQGRLTMLNAKLEDNPKYFDAEKGQFNDGGKAYLETIENQSPLNFKRMRLGLWVQAEGAIYEEYDMNKHILYGPLPNFSKGYITGVDWGTRDATTMLTFGITQNDTLVLVDEVYKTGMTTEDCLVEAEKIRNRFNPKVWIADPEGLSPITSFRRKGFNVVSADNDVKKGINVVKQRLRENKLLFHSHSVKEPDTKLQANLKPWRLTEEIGGYVWDKLKEEPDKKSTRHALDACRYACVWFEMNKNRQLPATSTSAGGRFG